ncbi:flagellin N-terminal helical domain-containing protein [Alsobacter sp. SYSU BS001988]
MVAISSTMRSAVSVLQATSLESDMAQKRLSTGRRVNSAVDNAVNYFNSASLNARAGQMSGLLDTMSNSVQTIQAASKGIDGIMKLVQQAQSTVKQAQSDATTNRPTVTGTALATAAETALTGTSLKDVALGKALGDGNGATANTATATYAGNLGVAAASVSFQLSIVSGNTTYTSTALTATSTVRDLVAEINKSGVASAYVDDNGKLKVDGLSTNTLKIGLGAGATGAAANTDAIAGGQNTLIGLAATDYTTGVSASGGNSSVRSNLVSQFNDLRTQIDQLAKDAGFNGTNLLQGNKMTVVFNEKTGSNQNKLDVQGQTISAANLGIQAAVNSTTAGSTNFQDDTELSNAADSLTNALTSLRSLSSNLGSSLTVVQTRQEFTKDLISTLKSGADNLVNADQNEEAANLLALQTRQQLAQTAMSMSNQAEQGILRLF